MKAPSAVLLHDWAGAVGDWADAGWVAALTAAGSEVWACDLPGHARSADVRLPADADPVAWTARAVLADLVGLGVRPRALAGVGLSCAVAVRAAVAAPDEVAALVLVGPPAPGVDTPAAGAPAPAVPAAAMAAAALRDAAAPMWRPEAADLVRRARVRARADGHDPAALAHWLDTVAGGAAGTWPALPRLAALDAPVLVATGAGDAAHPGAPRLAQRFRDGRVVTVPGSGEDVLRAPALVAAVVDVLVADLARARAGAHLRGHPASVGVPEPSSAEPSSAEPSSAEPSPAEPTSAGSAPRPRRRS